ncbi:ATP-dependent Clp protease ATP-binding subunit [Candidatus Saccharibacteria bacterium]|nr:ATP-dependent Clp protease ATP-binding subunit [Candidatus Saccharibacteria bacterium]
MNEFNPHSTRAKEARLGKFLGHFAIKTLFALISVACAVFAIYYLGKPLSFFLLIPLILILILYLWYAFHLSHLPLGKTDNITDLLSANAIIALGHHPSVEKSTLVENLKNTRSGHFLAARYGLNENFLKSLDATGVTLENIFEKAREVRALAEVPSIAGGVLLIAYVLSCQNHEQKLNEIKLDKDDLINGMVWYDYLHGLVKEAKTRRRTGGIGRDLSFGYIPTLEKYGENISARLSAYSRVHVNQANSTEAVAQMLKTFSTGGRQNVALVGKDGSGRSTIVTAFADALLDSDNPLVPHNLKYRQVFKLDAASLVSGTKEQGDTERLVAAIFAEVAKAKNIILYLDNAELFFKSGVGSVDLTNLIEPYVSNSNLRLIFTFDEAAFLELSAHSPRLSSDFNKITVTASDEKETLKVMQDRVPLLESRHKVVYSIWALKESYRLSLRYLQDLAEPGAAVNLLETAATFAENGYVSDASVARAVEKTVGVKLGGETSLDTKEERDRLLNLESLIHERLIDQVPAVKAVSDALRRAAAGVRNENRPIGTFLFLGPTGVGKTELSKAIAAVYFNNSDNFIRVDLNEFVSESDVARLIDSKNPTGLISSIKLNPFSVVLFDEIEKAHPLVLTALLQVLDEGILRDDQNHDLSFKDAIIVATSNAGSAEIREWVKLGADLSAKKEELTNNLIKNGTFKPEFLNRFDEVCLFKPLSKDDLLKMVDIILNSVNKTLEPRKISITLTDDAKALLAEKGYDPELGARPLRRLVQSTVENFVAKQVIAGAATSGSVLTLDANAINSELPPETPLTPPAA